MQSPRYPSLYQINTRVWLSELSRALDRRATLDDIPDSDLDRLVSVGFDWLWLLSVWQTGPEGQRVSRTHREWRHEFAATLTDLRDDDIAGSGFAIAGYTVHRDLGGDAALARLRERLRQRGLRLMLDFVPNHTALDHHWVADHPEYYIGGSELELVRFPQNYAWVRRPTGDLLLAHGRDPYFDGWPDTLQLDYGNPSTQAAMTTELLKIAAQCDGVRCDMAMLIVPEVFERTWGIAAEPFWPTAIQRVREQFPDFCFMAEVYWGMEWALQQQGFDCAYDKRLYDRLREGHARPIREHFKAGLDYQNKLARFVENHDEPRAAATFTPKLHIAAAALTYLSPGLRFFHDGQLDGRRARISPHLIRRPDESPDEQLVQFYGRLLSALRAPALRDGNWSMLDCVRAWHDNDTSDNFVAFRWEGTAGERVYVVVNYSPHQSQCFVRVSEADFVNSTVRFTDLLGSENYERVGDDLLGRGLFIDLPPWGCHVFDVQLLV